MSESEAKWASADGYVAGILLLAAFISGAVLIPAYTPEQTAQALAEYGSYRNLSLVSTVLLSFGVATAIPFLLGLRDALRPQGATWAAQAATLFILGLVLFGAVLAIQTASLGALADVYATGTAEERAAAVVAARAVASFSTGLFFIILLAGGAIVYGVVMWNSETFPNWLATLAIVAGVGLLLGLIPPLGTGTAGFILLSIAVILLLGWFFGSAFFLGRRAARPAAMSP